MTLRVPGRGPARTQRGERGRVISVISGLWVSSDSLPRQWGRGVVVLVALILSPSPAESAQCFRDSGASALRERAGGG